VPAVAKLAPLKGIRGRFCLADGLSAAWPVARSEAMPGHFGRDDKAYILIGGRRRSQGLKPESWGGSNVGAEAPTPGALTARAEPQKTASLPTYFFVLDSCALFIK
jgi:hypothetical protein